MSTADGAGAHSNVPAAGVATRDRTGCLIILTVISPWYFDIIS
jgi:hypothetical protein